MATEDSLSEIIWSFIVRLLDINATPVSLGDVLITWGTCAVLHYAAGRTLIEAFNGHNNPPASLLSLTLDRLPDYFDEWNPFAQAWRKLPGFVRRPATSLTKFIGGLAMIGLAVVESILMLIHGPYRTLVWLF